MVFSLIRSSLIKANFSIQTDNFKLYICTVMLERFIKSDTFLTGMPLTFVMISRFSIPGPQLAYLV